MIFLSNLAFKIGCYRFQSYYYTIYFCNENKKENNFLLFDLNGLLNIFKAIFTLACRKYAIGAGGWENHKSFPNVTKKNETVQLSTVLDGHLIR